MSDLSWLNPTPHAIAVYASQPTSPLTTQHSLPSGRYSLLGPDFHRLDRTSFAWRTHAITSVAPQLQQVRLRASDHDHIGGLGHQFRRAPRAATQPRRRREAGLRILVVGCSLSCDPSGVGGHSCNGGDHTTLPSRGL